MLNAKAANTAAEDLYFLYSLSHISPQPLLFSNLYIS